MDPVHARHRGNIQLARWAVYSRRYKHRPGRLNNNYVLIQSKSFHSCERAVLCEEGVLHLAHSSCWNISTLRPDEAGAPARSYISPNCGSSSFSSLHNIHLQNRLIVPPPRTASINLPYGTLVIPTVPNYHSKKITQDSRI